MIGEVKERDVPPVQPLLTGRSFGFPMPSENNKNFSRNRRISGNNLKNDSPINMKTEVSCDQSSFDSSGNDYDESFFKNLSKEQLAAYYSEIKSLLSPESIEFLRNRGTQKLRSSSDAKKSTELLCSEYIFQKDTSQIAHHEFMSVRNEISSTVHDDKFIAESEEELQMAQVSAEGIVKMNLQWTSAESSLNSSPKSVRFDLNGLRIIEKSTALENIDEFLSVVLCDKNNQDPSSLAMLILDIILESGYVISSDDPQLVVNELFHHEYESDLPGYNYVEMCEFLSSKVSRQRILGLEMLQGIFQLRDIVFSIESYWDIRSEVKDGLKIGSFSQLAQIWLDHENLVNRISREIIQRNHNKIDGHHFSIEDEECRLLIQPICRLLMRLEVTTDLPSSLPWLLKQQIFMLSQHSVLSSLSTSLEVFRTWKLFFLSECEICARDVLNSQEGSISPIVSFLPPLVDPLTLRDSHSSYEKSLTEHWQLKEKLARQKSSISSNNQENEEDVDDDDQDDDNSNDDDKDQSKKSNEKQPMDSWSPVESWALHCRASRFQTFFEDSSFRHTFLQQCRQLLDQLSERSELHDIIESTNVTPQCSPLARSAATETATRSTRTMLELWSHMIDLLAGAIDHTTASLCQSLVTFVSTHLPLHHPLLRFLLVGSYESTTTTTSCALEKNDEIEAVVEDSSRHSTFSTSWNSLQIGMSHCQRSLLGLYLHIGQRMTLDSSLKVQGISSFWHWSNFGPLFFQWQTFAPIHDQPHSRSALSTCDDVNDLNDRKDDHENEHLSHHDFIFIQWMKILECCLQWKQPPALHFFQEVRLMWQTSTTTSLESSTSSLSQHLPCQISSTSWLQFFLEWPSSCSSMRHPCRRMALRMVLLGWQTWKIMALEMEEQIRSQLSPSASGSQEVVVDLQSRLIEPLASLLKILKEWSKYLRDSFSWDNERNSSYFTTLFSSLFSSSPIFSTAYQEKLWLGKFLVDLMNVIWGDSGASLCSWYEQWMQWMQKSRNDANNNKKSNEDEISSSCFLSMKSSFSSTHNNVFAMISRIEDLFFQEGRCFHASFRHVCDLASHLAEILPSTYVAHSLNQMLNHTPLWSIVNWSSLKTMMFTSHASLERNGMWEFFLSLQQLMLKSWVGATTTTDAKTPMPANMKALKDCNQSNVPPLTMFLQELSSTICGTRVPSVSHGLVAWKVHQLQLEFLQAQWKEKLSQLNYGILTNLKTMNEHNEHERSNSLSNTQKELVSDLKSIETGIELNLLEDMLVHGGFTSPGVFHYFLFRYFFLLVIQYPKTRNNKSNDTRGSDSSSSNTMATCVSISSASKIATEFVRWWSRWCPVCFPEMKYLPDFPPEVLTDLHPHDTHSSSNCWNLCLQAMKHVFQSQSQDPKHRKLSPYPWMQISWQSDWMIQRAFQSPLTWPNFFPWLVVIGQWVTWKTMDSRSNDPIGLQHKQLATSQPVMTVWLKLLFFLTRLSTTEWERCWNEEDFPFLERNIFVEDSSLEISGESMNVCYPDSPSRLWEEGVKIYQQSLLLVMQNILDWTAKLLSISGTDQSSQKYLFHSGCEPISLDSYSLVMEHCCDYLDQLLQKDRRRLEVKTSSSSSSSGTATTVSSRSSSWAHQMVEGLITSCTESQENRYLAASLALLLPDLWPSSVPELLLRLLCQEKVMHRLNQNEDVMNVLLRWCIQRRAWKAQEHRQTKLMMRDCKSENVEKMTINNKMSSPNSKENNTSCDQRTDAAVSSYRMDSQFLASIDALFSFRWEEDRMSAFYCYCCCQLAESFFGDYEKLKEYEIKDALESDDHRWKDLRIRKWKRLFDHSDRHSSCLAQWINGDVYRAWLWMNQESMKDMSQGNIDQCWKCWLDGIDTPFELAVESRIHDLSSVSMSELPSLVLALL